ncbi:hypothetical protein G7046_g8927 [Stylonectria norvegica]|nr:hypothetical protein G7046_g8927 [Stylonectria norvegica]
MPSITPYFVISFQPFCLFVCDVRVLSNTYLDVLVLGHVSSMALLYGCIARLGYDKKITWDDDWKITNMNPSSVAYLLLCFFLVVPSELGKVNFPGCGRGTREKLAQRRTESPPSPLTGFTQLPI